MSSDDPLDRLAGSEDWSDRVRAAEREAAKVRRQRARRNWGVKRAGSGRGISKIFLAIVAVMIASGVALWTEAIPPEATVFIFVLSGWIVTLCFHEFAHALTAHRGGDDTVAGKGYLTLDPRKYGHPVLTLLLPLLILIIGGLPLPGGAVMIETHRLRSRFRDALVSAAGPAVNIAFAIVLLATISIFGPEGIYSLSEPQAAFWSAMTFFAYLQVAAAILNLIPVPGLDGYGIIEPYLPSNVRYTLGKAKPFGIIIIFVLLYLPPVRAVFHTVVDLFMALGGEPVNGYYFGYNLFQFWK